MNKLVTLSMLAGALAAAPSLHAHHGPGQFNGGDVTVTGVITKIRLVNPHAYVYFDAVDESGEAEAWRCEMQAGSLLKRAGWTADMFPIGGEITVNGAAGTREKTACLFVTGILPDGSELGRSTQRREDVDNAVAAKSKLVDGKLDLNGTWAAPQRYVDEAAAGGRGGGRGGPGGARGALPNGIVLTDAGTAAVARYQEAGGGNPRHRCEASNVFFDWTFDRHVNEIIQTDDTITMKYGLMDLVRTVHLGMDKHPDNIVPSQAGHSIGRLEGDTLHVDTIGFMNDGYISANFLYSDQLHATETFTYKAADNSLTRKYSAVDSKNFTGTYTGEDVVYISNTPFEDYSCVELMDDYIEPI